MFQLIFILLTLLLWIIVTIYWIVSAQKVERGHKGNEIFSFIKLIGSAIIIYLPLSTGGLIAVHFFTTTFLSEIAGTVLCVVGTMIMIRSREYLSKNWSGNVVIQEGHTLSKNGPYQYVRHPIYAGGLLAMLATAIVTAQIFGFIWVLFCTFGLNLKIRKEEELLTKQFPGEYQRYQKEVKKMIPYIW